MSRKPICIGLFGFGSVGKGVYDVLQDAQGLQVSIKKICVKNPNKSRPIADEFFTLDKDEILNDPEINVILELTNDPEEAFEIVSEALKKGKAVVSANKSLVANYFTELLELQKEYGSPLLYESACCASLPVIRNLEEYYDNDLLKCVEGIINGSTNYILTAMFRDNRTFADALAEAQRLGFAESDPSLDVKGFDARYKLVLLLVHAFGLIVDPKELFCHGIDQINDLATTYAREKGYAIKLVAKAERHGSGVSAFVMPTFVRANHELSLVADEFNGLAIESSFAERQFFLGKGAGAYPTALAVLSDVSALTYGYRYEYKKLGQHQTAKLNKNPLVEVFVSFTAGNAEEIRQDLTQISESYQSASGQYFVGSIELDKLRHAAWLHREDVCVIQTPSPLKPVISEVETEEISLEAAAV